MECVLDCCLGSWDGYLDENEVHLNDEKLGLWNWISCPCYWDGSIGVNWL
jgi:hypothetical protein